MCDQNITVKRIRKLIDDSKKTREEIAKSKEFQCDTSTITKHYNGDRNINSEYIIKYAKYFNVSADYLLGISDVASNDRDLQFICDYMGLEEQTIEHLSFINKDKIMLPTRGPLPKLPLFTSYFHDKYCGFYRDIVNEFLQSDFLLDIITNCCAEKILEYSLKELISFKNSEKSIEKISKYEKEKLSVYHTFIYDYFRQHDLNIFNTQKSVVNFLNSITSLNTIEEDEIEDIIHFISLELHRDEIIQRKTGGKENGNNPKT